MSEHLLPKGTLPGTRASSTIWTGCEGPRSGSWADRRALLVGLLSWVLLLSLAIWLHVTALDDFFAAFPYVIGAKILVFVWVLFGVSVLRPLFMRRSRQAAAGSETN
ncbi:MAG: hypothetical protein ACKOPI_00135 [bacterium]